MLPDDGRPRLAWRSPLADTLAELAGAAGRAAWPCSRPATRSGTASAACCSGTFRPARSRILPHVSAFQEACSRLGWAMEDVRTLSAARPRRSTRLRRHLQPGRRLLVLTDDGAAPGRDRRAAGRARLRCQPDLGAGGSGRAGRARGRRTRRRRDRRRPASPTSTCWPSSSPEPGPDALPAIPGLPDDAFDHDGQLTKAEVRALTLAALAPLDGELLWDVGAGAGSVAIEWLRAGPRHARRRDRARPGPGRADRGQRRRAWACPSSRCAGARRPRRLTTLGCPRCDFRRRRQRQPLGFSTAAGLVCALGVDWSPTPSPLAGEAALLAFHAAHGGKLLRVGLSRSELVGGQLVWRPAMPVTQLSARKPCGAASS